MEFVTWARAQWDRIAAWISVVLGALVLVLGWVGVTGTPYVFEQIPYVISGGLGGIFLLGVGAMLWISADLRDEWRKLDALAPRDDSGASEPGAAPTPGPGRDSDTAGNGTTVRRTRRPLTAEAP